MNEVLFFLIGDREYGMHLPIVKSIYGEDAFVEAYREKETRTSGMQAHGKMQTRWSNTGFSPPLYNLPVILKADSFPDQSEPPDLSVEPSKGKVMLLEIEGHSMALKVDRIEGVVSVGKDQIEPLSPLFKGPSLDCFPQVIRKDGRLILLLDPKGIERLEKRSVASATERREEYAEWPELHIKAGEAEKGMIQPAEETADDTAPETSLIRLEEISKYKSGEETDIIPADEKDSREVMILEDIMSNPVPESDPGDVSANDIPITESEAVTNNSEETVLEDIIVKAMPEPDPEAVSPYDPPTTAPEFPAGEADEENLFLSKSDGVLSADNQSLLDRIGADIDAEIRQDPFLLEDHCPKKMKERETRLEDRYPKKMKERLTRMVHENRLSDMVIRVLTRQVEEIVVCEMGKMKGVLLQKLQENGLNHAGKYQRESP